MKVSIYRTVEGGDRIEKKLLGKAPGVPVFRLSTDFRIRGFSRPLCSVFIKSSKITVGGLEEKKTRGKKIFFGS